MFSVFYSLTLEQKPLQEQKCVSEMSGTDFCAQIDPSNSSENVRTENTNADKLEESYLLEAAPAFSLATTSISNIDKVIDLRDKCSVESTFHSSEQKNSINSHGFIQKYISETVNGNKLKNSRHLTRKGLVMIVEEACMGEETSTVESTIKDNQESCIPISQEGDMVKNSCIFETKEQLYQKYEIESSKQMTRSIGNSEFTLKLCIIKEEEKHENIKEDGNKRLKDIQKIKEEILELCNVESPEQVDQAKSITVTVTIPEDKYGKGIWYNWFVVPSRTLRYSMRKK